MRIYLLIFIVLLTGCKKLDTSNREIDLDQEAMLDYKSSYTLERTDDYKIPVQEKYYISPGDTVEIKFPYLPEMNDLYLITTDGMISLPFIGFVRAAGLTSVELQKVVNNAYAEFNRSKFEHAPEDREYRINIGDTLDIKFVYQEDFNQTTVVRPDGKISLSLIGTVVVINKTPEQVSKELQKLYRKYLQDPDLVTMVRDFAVNEYYVDGEAFRHRPGLKNLDNAVVIIRASQPLQFFVGGEVASPGFFPYSGGVSALQAIIMAGGNKLSAEMRQVAIIRKGPGEKPQLILRNLKSDVTQNEDGEIDLLNAATGDTMLKPYDVVIVPKTNIAKVTDYVDRYIYTLVPALRNMSFGFIYNLNPVDEIQTTTTAP